MEIGTYQSLERRKTRKMGEGRVGLASRLTGSRALRHPRARSEQQEEGDKAFQGNDFPPLSVTPEFFSQEESIWKIFAMIPRDIGRFPGTMGDLGNGIIEFHHRFHIVQWVRE